MERRMQQQRDGWSCGLRAIGHLLLRAFNREVENYEIDLRKVLDFILNVLGMRRLPIEQFRDADLGKLLKIPRKREPLQVLLDKNTLQVALRDREQ